MSRKSYLREALRLHACAYARDVATSIQIDIKDKVCTLRDALAGLDLEEEWAAGRVSLSASYLSVMGAKLTWQAAFCAEMEQWLNDKRVASATSAARELLSHIESVEERDDSSDLN